MRHSIENRSPFLDRNLVEFMYSVPTEHLMGGELQRALAEAGLNSGDMEFNLKGQEQQTAENENDASGGNQSANEDETTDEDGEVLTAWESGIFANGRLDMRA